MRAIESGKDLSPQTGTDLVRGVLGDGRFEDLAVTYVERDLGGVATVHADMTVPTILLRPVIRPAIALETSIKNNALSGAAGKS
jgi:hypothetical protein